MERMQLPYVLSELNKAVELLNGGLFDICEGSPLLLDARVDVLHLVYVNKLEVVQLQSSDQHKLGFSWVLVQTLNRLHAHNSSEVLDVLEGQHQKSYLLFSVEVLLRVLADLDADLEEDVKDLVAVKHFGTIFLCTFFLDILHGRGFLHMVCSHLFARLRRLGRVLHLHRGEALHFEGQVIHLQLAEQLFSHVHHRVHHRNWVLLKLRALVVTKQAKTSCEVQDEVIGWNFDE